MSKGKPKSLNVNSMAAAKGLASLLKNGNVTIVVVLADWCGACKRVKPEWLQTLKRTNKNNVALIDSEVLPNTVLREKLNITHFPSVFEIPPNGKPTLLENVREPNVVVNTNNVSKVNNTVNNMNNSNNNNNNNINNNANNMNNNNANNMNNNNANNMNNMNNNNANNTNTANNDNTITNSMREDFSLPNRSFAPSLEKLKGGRRSRRVKRTRSRSRVSKNKTARR